jgi:segregation and condensation protein B
MIERDEAERAVEAVLFASEHPLSLAEMRAHLGEEIDIRTSR